MINMIRENHGMTLLEIMLALMVLSMVMTMVSISLSGTFDMMESVRTQGDIYYQAQVAMQRIREDVTSAIYDPKVQFIGENIDQNGARADRLSFLSLGHIVFDKEHDSEGPGIISYAALPHREGDGRLVLYRSDILLKPGLTDETISIESETAPGYIIADHLRSVTFTYLTGGEEESDNWSSEPAESDSDPIELPAAVKCTLEFWLSKQEETTVSFTTNILIPVGWSNLTHQSNGQ